MRPLSYYSQLFMKGLPRAGYAQARVFVPQMETEMTNDFLCDRPKEVAPAPSLTPARAHEAPPRPPALLVGKNSGAKNPERHARSGLEFGEVRFFFLADPCIFNMHQRCASFWILCFFLAKSENGGSKQVKIAFRGLNQAMLFSLFLWGLSGAQSDASGK